MTDVSHSLQSCISTNYFVELSADAFGMLSDRKRTPVPEFDPEALIP